MKSINVNGNIYYIESVPFEDKSEQDEEGYYEYFTKESIYRFTRTKK